MIQQSQQIQSRDRLKGGGLPDHGSPSAGPGGGPESVAATRRIDLQQRPSVTPQHIEMILQYASKSAAELRAQGVHERVIQFVEQCRKTLQRHALHEGKGVQNPAGSVPQHNLAPPYGGPPSARGPMQNPASAIISSLMRSEPQLTQAAIKIIQQLKTNIPQQRTLDDIQFY